MNTQNRKLKHFTGVLTAVVIALTILLSASACSEGGAGRGAEGKAIGLGHGNCVTEVTVIVDGFGQPKRVIFDEIFPVGNVCTNTALGSAAETVTVGEGDKAKKYYKYLHIGDKYFVADEYGVYSQMGGGDIEDLADYCTTGEGVQWYYDSFIANKMFVCAVAAEGTEIDGVHLADKYKFNTANGSMRKRYSRYWSSSGTGNIGQISGLGFVGNMDMLENYLLTYGFDALDDVDSAITLPNKDGNDTNFNIIGGVTTGATLSGDTGKYLKVAKAAYENALQALRQ